MTSAAPHLRLVHPPERNTIEVTTHVIRRFLGMPPDEATELTFFERGKRIHVAHALSIEAHIRLLREAEKMRGFEGAYMLANPMRRDVRARYRSDEIHRADNGRVNDGEILQRRAVYIDVDSVRPKGISATDAELEAAYDVSRHLEDWLEAELGTDAAIGHGASGNGYFTLIGIEPRPNVPEDAQRIARLLRLLGKKFNTARAVIDEAVFNAARLMPAPGTMKCKGENAPERVHRRTSFCARPGGRRIPLEVFC